MASERGTDMATLALAWVMAQPQVTSAIVGPRKPEHLEPARRAIDWVLGEDERRRLSEIFTFS